MTATQTFELVSIGDMLLSTVLPITLLIGLPCPRKLFQRTVVVILLAWLSLFVYTVFVYNPAGIASGIEQGIDSPEMKFDNNTIGITLFFGWLNPTISVCAFLLGRHIWQRLSGGADKNPTP
jgi:hypothetical protein